MLLLITGSVDGTSDLLVKELGNKIFRFNYDLAREYALEFYPDYWKITNPAGHSIDSKQVTSAFWWKAFNFYIADQENYIVEEIKYIYREIYHWCRIRGLAKGSAHDFHNHMGKMNILSVASKYFKTPKTLITFRLEGVKNFTDKPVVAKSFASGLTTTNKVLMTTAVNKESLHPDYPWFLQELVSAKADVTIFVCGKKQFAYTRDRSRLKGLDWRAEQSFDDLLKKEWFRFELSSEVAIATSDFCNELGVDWGRLDLMDDGLEMTFLEFNANGQWVFLDYSGDDGLVKSVVNYLMPEVLN